LTFLRRSVNSLICLPVFIEFLYKVELRGHLKSWNEWLN
jgi:hypothetical protein